MLHARRTPVEVHVYDEALAAMVLEGQRCYPNETGGLLLGHWVPGQRTVEVHAVVGPGPRAEHHRTSFLPDWAWQQREVARLYAASGRTLAYLGDWHTHPDGPLRPSWMDRMAAMSIARAPEARAPTPILLILALRRAEEPQVGAWLYERRHLTVCTTLVTP